MISGFKKTSIYPFYGYKVLLSIDNSDNNQSPKYGKYTSTILHDYLLASLCRLVKMMAMQLVNLLTQQMQVVVSIVTVKQLKRSHFSLKKKTKLFVDMKRDMT